jgi:tetratricopeptide (TPR) repeat protein
MDQPAPPARPVVRVASRQRPAHWPASSVTLNTALRVFLYTIFAGFALLGTTGAYLGAVSFFDWLHRPKSYETTFTIWMFLGHGAVGAAVFVPFVVFGLWHFRKASWMPNRGAVRLGIALFTTGLLVGLTGFALFQIEGLPQLPTGTLTRAVVYWLHVVLPFAAVWLYVRHRLLGPPIKWRYAKGWAVGVALFVGGMLVMHSQSPHRWFAEGPKEGEAYFHPSDSRTADGKFIPAESLMSDTYCMKCHADIYNDHLHSAHKFSSFNNPAYLASVRETREFAMKRDGNVKASRWCAGCHDPVPFFSGAFDDPNFDLEKHPTAHAGITCVACHSITNVNGPVGNGAYTIEAPDHYPFAFNYSPVLRAVSDQLIKAKPDLHKKTFLKPFHKTAEFCSTCHKVFLPVELNHYKDFLRGQNHYDTYLLSGASGHGARSFYYPPKAFGNCASCHLPLKPSTDFGAKDRDGSGEAKVHNHLFPAANTGLPELLKHESRYAHLSPGLDRAIAEHAAFLRGKDPSGKDKVLRVDLFGLKDGATTDPAKLIAPLRPNLPKLKPGQTYVVEVVIRTLFLGHPLTQGTADSNEVWVDFKASAGGREIAHSGAMAGPGDTGPVDEWSHFLNVLMLDRHGNRISRRNPQDIFTPLYDHQIPPGSAQVVHYRLDVPKDVSGPVELDVRVRYRKFDDEYMRFVYRDRPVPPLPVVDLCEDKVTLPVEGVAEAVPAQESPIQPAWQRWNDYGIGNLLEGPAGAKKGNYRQAEAAFQTLLALGAKEAAPHAHLNLARVYVDEGRLDEAAQQLDRLAQADPQHQWWTRAWLTAVVNSETATQAEHLDAAIADLEKIVDPANQPRDRGFDFSQDYVIQNLLANRLWKRRLFEPDGSESQRQFVLRAVAAAERVLDIDPDDVQAHDLLKQCYGYLAGADAPPESAGDGPDLGELPALARRAADGKLAKADRLAAADQLRRGLDGVNKLPPRADQPKLNALRSMWRDLRPAYHEAADAEVKAALAAALAALHREYHLIVKPDEVARSNAARIYREKHPAANYAARDRVVYPTTEGHKKAILAGGELLKE